MLSEQEKFDLAVSATKEKRKNALKKEVIEEKARDFAKKSTEEYNKFFDNREEQAKNDFKLQQATLEATKKELETLKKQSQEQDETIANLKRKLKATEARARKPISPLDTI